jgi:sodium pump decarboxylase gamma subunit
MGGMPVWLSTMLIGLGTVFVGLISLIYIIKLSSVIIRALEKKKAPATEESVETAPIQDRGALVAAVSACVAEVMGRDVSGLRIVSLRRVG